MPIPEFVGNPHEYWLPPGTHECTLSEIEERFVQNEARRRVWDYFQFALERIRDLGGSLDELLVDGSFVTARDNPDDVDAVCLIPPDRLRAMLADSDDWQALHFFLARPHEARRLLGVHLFCVHTPENLEQIRKTFALGIGDAGLRPPHPEKDPEDLNVPEEKGILSVDTSGFFDGEEEG